MRGGIGANTSSLIKTLLNVKDIIVKDARFETGKNGEKVLVITAAQPKRTRHKCGVCGRKAKGYDSSTRRWRSLDLGCTKVFIEASIQRVCCKIHGVVTAMVPWARHKSRFTKDFEDTVAWLMMNCSRLAVSDYMRIAWNSAGGISKRVYEERRQNMPDMFDGLTCIGIDETSYKKGHKYMTVVVDHTTGRLIWAGAGLGKAVLDGFFQLLTKEQKDNIRHVTADGARWIADCVAEHCPNAERSIDPFHVVQWATEALDNVRRRCWQNARKEVAGKSAKSSTSSKAAALIKGSRYPLLKNPASLSKNQAAVVEMIANFNPGLYKAYRLKEMLRLIFKFPFEQAKEELSSWIKWAWRCRIPEFVELQKKIRRHFNAIASSIKYGLSNARVEAINNKIKVSIRMGYGFRNTGNLIGLIMLRCSGLPIHLPGRG
jgi:transposase